MANYKSLYDHEHEEAIAIYCAQNNKEFDEANAYDVVLETFKDNPIKKKYKDKETGEDREYDKTQSVARQIEFQPKTIARIAAKAEVYKKRFASELYAKNIEQAKKDRVPNLDKLVENLYLLNIIDGQSYLAFVNNLMQIVYSRDNEIPEDDKTCMFFNGVPRNGKSATAKAICEVEAQYGNVYRASSPKILSAQHAERVYQSHLNYFDEIKSSDIVREDVLSLINGGERELDPKNKKQYMQHVNTNLIFTSNDLIHLIQRRVSLIKFGNRLNGRPLGEGTLKKIITEIMNSLPDFSCYHELYQTVSTYNENRVSPLAIDAILTFFTSKFGNVSDKSVSSLCASINFNTHHIYNNFKDTYNKQTISAERKSAVRIALQYFTEKGLITEVGYQNCTTKNYSITGQNYLRIMEGYSKLNTKDENNKKISKEELKELLKPYFYPEESDTDNKKDECHDVADQLFSKEAYIDEKNSLYGKSIGFNPYEIDHNTLQIANISYKRLITQICAVPNDIANVKLHVPVNDIITDLIKTSVIPDLCNTITLDFLTRIFRSCIPDFTEQHEQQLKHIYTSTCCLWENGTVDYGEHRKIKSAGQLVFDDYVDWTENFTTESKIKTACQSNSRPLNEQIDDLHIHHWSVINDDYIAQKQIRNEKLKLLLQENTDVQKLIATLSTDDK